MKYVFSPIESQDNVRRQRSEPNVEDDEWEPLEDFPDANQGESNAINEDRATLGKLPLKVM